jgi:uncharacterized LabA/DUF88 family protein
LENLNRIPAWAVVDSRNLIGQAGDYSLPETGFTCAGLKEAMGDYGFSVVNVSVGIGLSRTSRSGVLKRVHDENAAMVGALKAEQATILEGELRHEGTEVREKMVDVLCALEVARLIHGGLPEGVRTLLLFSRDLDLLPAANYANQRGFRTYVVSSDPTYERSSHRVLLTKASYRALTQTIVPPVDPDSELAAFMLDAGPYAWMVGERAQLQGQSGHRLTHESGVRGFIISGSVPVSPGDAVTALAADVIFEAGGKPIALCSSDMEIDVTRPWLVPTPIARRIDAVSVEVEVEAGIRKMKCAVGEAETGQQVLVRSGTGGLYRQQAGARFVGPLEVPTQTALEAGRITVGRPTPVQVERVDSNQTISGRTEAGIRVRLNRSFGVVPRPSHWYAAVPTAASARGSRSGQLLEMVSTELVGF